MPRSPDLNREIRDARHDAILRAATKLFAKRGFSATKIGDIAEAAKLSHGLVYHYFDSKEAIFEEILESRRREAWAKLEAIRQEAGGLAAIETFLQNAMDDTRERPEIHAMIAQAMLGQDVPEKLRTRLRRGGRDAEDRVALIIEAAQKASEIDDDVTPRELAATVMCVLRGLALGTLHGQPVQPSLRLLLRMFHPSEASTTNAKKRGETSRVDAFGTSQEGAKCASPAPPSKRSRKAAPDSPRPRSTSKA